MSESGRGKPPGGLRGWQSRRDGRRYVAVAFAAGCGGLALAVQALRLGNIVALALLLAGAGMLVWSLGRR